MTLLRVGLSRSVRERVLDDGVTVLSTLKTLKFVGVTRVVR